MTSLLTLPRPPKSILSTKEQIETFKKMLNSLEESAKYQEKVIAYHTDSLKEIKKEFKETKAQLDLCRNTIKILSKSQKSASSISSSASKNGSNESKAIKIVKEEAVAEKKEKSSSKSKSPKIVSKKKQNLKQEKTKTRNSLPASPVLEKYKNITEMVLEFVEKKKGAVVEISQIIKYVYPKGLSKEERTKVLNSFSKVLSLSMKKGIVERTVPGKYRWRGK